MSIKLDQDDTQVLGNDANEIQQFYKKYCASMSHISKKRNFEEMARYYQVVYALYEVLQDVTNKNIDDQVLRCADMVEENGRHFKNYKYNIIPLNFPGSSEEIMELPEIRGAIDAISDIDGLPMPDMSSIQRHEDKSIQDLIEYLSLAFGFQKSNVENQRENMVLLLANISTRTAAQEGHPLVDTVNELWKKIFGNYKSWCCYLHITSSIIISHDITEHKKQQLKLLHIGLYLLIWGEASNVRFMPECLCYIFHHMAKQLHDMVDENNFQPPQAPVEEGSFLKNVIEPIFKVLQKEAQKSRGGTAGHSAWRNYDDLNELFWSEKCFTELNWPPDLSSNFFYKGCGMARKPKTNFVEVRTFLHIFRSFNRMWMFFILAFQAMLIVSWSSSGSLSGITDGTVLKNVLSVFITAALLNFITVTLDIMFTVQAWGSMFVVAIAWIIILPLTYSSSIKYPSGAGKILNSWIGDWYNQSVYNIAIVIYMVPDILAALFFLLPQLQNVMERSDSRVLVLLMWWIQPRLYVGRGMHGDILSILKYVFFWAVLLISKLAFSFYVEISPLIDPTKFILDQQVGNYEWHQIFPFLPRNLGVVITIWAPIVMVYFMDTQIWYAIFSTVFGGVSGALSHVGEIRTLGMLRARFKSIPEAFSQCNAIKQREQAFEHRSFFRVWNSFINSLREEDFISDREKDMLMAPSYSSNLSIIQWPPFLLASKVPAAVHMAMNSKEGDEHELIEKIKLDGDRYDAVIECYKSLMIILNSLLLDTNDQNIVNDIDKKVTYSMIKKTFLEDFEMAEIGKVSSTLARLLQLLKSEPINDVGERKIVNALQDFMEITTRDFMKDGQSFKDEDERNQRFMNLNMNMIKEDYWREKFVRLHLLLTMKDSAMDVPINLDARRRITFFANSLFMKMPRAPRVHDMISFSVLTPYYNEEVLYSSHDLNRKNEDGISILFYLQKIYPDEWNNFLERIGVESNNEVSIKGRMDDIRLWASYRGQTLARTVRGMMYYRRALELQCYEDMINDQGYGLADLDTAKAARSKAIADIKFTYVVSCQLYGVHKTSKDSRERGLYENILNLMLTYPALRIAYIDEKEVQLRNGKIEKQYYSVLVKGDDEEIYRIRLPGKPTEVGEGKPNNQNHAIIFTRGEALQAIDMNQDNYLEEAFKMRNLLEEFLLTHGKSEPTILGVREHIFTGSVSSLAWFMSSQETSFVTIGQRVLANPLKVRFHYGHPDVFDRLFHLTRGGISKASKIINLSEDIFAGFNSTLRRGNVTHHEYIQLGKGRDVGMNQISNFEAKVANGNGEQTLCRDIYRLGHRFDFYRMLSLYFTTVGFYFNSMVAVLTVYVFLYGRLYLVLSGLEKSILQDPNIQNIKPFENALATQSVFQLGMLLVLPMMMEIGLEKGFGRALAEFVIMQLQLASVFFTFHLGTKTHYYGRTILHGGAKYRATGRGFVVRHAKFAENYRMYSRSHFVKALELLILLVVYLAYGSSYRSSSLYLYVTVSIWFLVFCWLFAPFVFNPSCFEWHKTVDDWNDWWKWMGNRGGIGLAPEQSWEAWWVSEHDHLRNATIRSLLLEFILSLRFLIYQYGIVYHLHIVHGNKSFLVYALSWLVIAVALVSLKVVSMGREKFVTRIQLVFRILKGIVFLVLIGLLVLLFVGFDLAVSDVGASILAFIPTGWFILLVAQLCGPLFRRLIIEPLHLLCCPYGTGGACRGPCCARFRQRTGAALRKMGPWDSIQEMARMYEYTMGLLIFLPIAVLSWFPFVSEFQTRLLFNQAFSRGLQISRILAGQNGSGTKSD
ncbi:Callose synthase 7 [Zea mays]|uniref:1,3-beta-glucan synthase n=1 Tax=Zea mays TaxID=4577 RepID=A0A1D6NNC2_MAIZE|nr:Callose synthase 7 [Zea mays]